MRSCSRAESPPAWRIVRADRPDAGTCVLALGGDLDLACVERLGELLRALESASPRRLFVDLREVTFIDLSTMRLLLAAADRTHARAGVLLLVPPPPPADRLLHHLKAWAWLAMVRPASVPDPPHTDMWARAGADGRGSAGAGVRQPLAG